MSSTHRLTRGSVRRSLSLAAAGAMVFALTPVQSAFATHGADEGARDITEADDVCTGRDRGEFDDIANEETDVAAECLNDLGIAFGFPDGSYRPTNAITREQMASFLARKMMAADQFQTDETYPPAPYTDREKIADAHIANVDLVTAEGVAEGKDDGSYGPGEPVTRAQMAAFIVREMETITGQELTAQADHFTDDNGNWSEENINILADLGIVEGDAAGNYNPGAPVTRGQMALFVARNVDALNDEFGITFTSLREPEPVESNQTFAVTPQEAAENTVSATSGTTAEQNRGARQYSVGDLDNATTYDIRLFPCENVTVTDGVVTFRDDNEGTTENPGDNEADIDEANVAARIEVVNGAALTTPVIHTEVQPVNGTITFTIDATQSDCVIPVIWVDTEDDETLELDADNAPTEAFGIGGQKTWVPEEAATGSLGTTDAEDETIVSVNKDANRIITDEFTYFYDANDRFFVAAGEDPCGNAANERTLAQFEAELSAGDQLDALTFYNANEELQSRFCLEDIAPSQPRNVTATRTGTTTARVTWDQPATGDADSFVIQRAAEECATADNADFAEVGTTDGDTEVFNDTGLTANQAYCYRVIAVVDGERSAPSDEAQAAAAPTPDNTRPQSLDTELTTTGGFANRLDEGDVIKVCFDEEMRTPDVGDAIEVRDADNTVGVITNGQNATFALSTATTTDVDDNTAPVGCPATQTLVITLTDTVTGTGGDGIVNVPATVTDSAGNTDLAGNEWDVLGSPDRVIDVETGAEPN